MKSKSVLCTASALVFVIIASGCAARKFNSSSSIKDVRTEETDLFKVTDLPVADYFDPMGDLARIETPLSTNFVSDFAVCAGYPDNSCTIEDLKRGISGPFLGAVAKIDSELQLSKTNRESMEGASQRAGLDAATLDWYRLQIESALKTEATLTKNRVTAQAEADVKLNTVAPLVAAESKVIEAAVADGFQFLNPVSYVQKYLSKTNRPQSRIAASVVLDYMRELRKNIYIWPASSDLSEKTRAQRVRFYKILTGALNPADPGKTDPKTAANEAERLAIIDYQSYVRIKAKAASLAQATAEMTDADWIQDLGDNSVNGTLNATPPHWNDLQSHYYAATGHRRHGCYTSVMRAIQYIQGEANLPEIIQGEGKLKYATLRDSAVRFCTSESKEIKGTGKIIHEWAVDETKIKAALEALRKNAPDNFDFTNFELAYLTKPLFARMWLTQVVRTPGKATNPVTNRPYSEFKMNPITKRPYNVFDYVMIAAPWAANFDQQQAVINAFYHDLKNNYDNKSQQPLAVATNDAIAKYVPGKSQGCALRPAKEKTDRDYTSVCDFNSERIAQTHSIGR